MSEFDSMDEIVFGDALEEFFSEDLTGTYEATLITKGVVSPNPSNVIPEWNGKPTKAIYLVLTFDVVDEARKVFKEFTEMHEYFPYVSSGDSDQLDMDQLKSMAKIKEDRNARLRSLGVPQAELNSFKASSLDGKKVRVTIKTTISKKDTVTRYHNVTKVTVPDEGDDVYSLV